jgi:hypothetical protein
LRTLLNGSPKTPFALETQPSNNGELEGEMQQPIPVPNAENIAFENQ